MPEIGPFTTDHPLILEPAQNGGWVVKQQPAHMGEGAGVLGAYTNAGDMLEALSCLDPETSK